MEDFEIISAVIANIVIAVIGVIAVMHSQSEQEKYRKWASVFGLIGQPAWFYVGWSTANWGIFFISFLYTYAWGKGFYNNWIKK